MSFLNKIIHSYSLERKIKRWSFNHKPVFIVGHTRTGTTVLARTMLKCPVFINLPNVPETNIFIRPQTLLFLDKAYSGKHIKLLSKKEIMRMNLEKGRKSYFNYLPKENIKLFYKDISPSLDDHFKLTENNIALHPIPDNYSEIWKIRGYKKLITKFLYMSSQYYENKRIIEKTPAHIKTVPQILSCFPNATIIICLRDPVEILASIRERAQKEYGKYGKVDDWLLISLDKYISNFIKLHSISKMVLTQYSNNIILSRYNDFTCAPEVHISWILKQLGIESTNSELVKYMLSGKNNNSFPDELLGADVQINKKDPLKYLSQSEIELIQNKLIDVYKCWQIEKKY